MSDRLYSLLDELDRLDNTYDPTVAIFDGHEAQPVVAKYGEGYRMLSNWVVHAREVTVDDISVAWDRHGEPRLAALSTQSHRFNASHFAEVADLE